MSIRRFITKNGPAVAVGACALAVASIVISVLSIGGGGAELPLVNKSWFYDLDKKSLFAVDPKQPEHVAPFDAPSGNRAVQAFVFGCDDCSDDNQFIGYLLQWKPDAQKRKQEELRKLAAGEDLNYSVERGQQIRRESEAEWHDKEAALAKTLISAVRRDGDGRCVGKKIKRCQPPPG